MILYQILGILLLFSAITFSSLAEGTHQLGLITNQPAGAVGAMVLGAQDVRPADSQSIFDKEYFFGSGADSSWQAVVNQQNIVIYPEDKINVFPEPTLGIGFVLEITRALPIKIIDAGVEKTARTFQPEVAGLLSDQKIELGDKDKISPALDSRLEKGTIISIVRVEETEIKETKLIDFKTIYQNDENLDKGLTRVVQAGKKGKKILTHLSRRENGREVSKTLIKTDITVEPIDEIIGRGTKEVIWGTGIATWFSAPAMTAAHNNLPRGTMVEVTNLLNSKKVTVKIIGGGIMGRAVIDLSPDAFSQLAPLGAGVINVKIAKP